MQIWNHSFTNRFSETARSGGGLAASLATACAALLLATLASGCTVERSFVRDGFAEDEAQRLKRVIIALEAFDFADFDPEAGEEPPASPEKTGELFLGMARDFLGHHSEYILLDAVYFAKSAAPAPTDAAKDPEAEDAPSFASSAGRALDELCKREVRGRSVEAIIVNRFLELEYDRTEAEVDLRLQAGLYDCAEQRVAWEVVGENEYDPEDDDLVQTRSFYVQRHGENAAVFVPAFFWMLRSAYDRLPGPVLNDADIDDKIEFDAVR